MIETTCAFTGHRPKSFPWGYNEAVSDCVLLKEVLAAGAEGVPAIVDEKARFHLRHVRAGRQGRERDDSRPVVISALSAGSREGNLPPSVFAAVSGMPFKR